MQRNVLILVLGLCTLACDREPASSQSGDSPRIAPVSEGVDEANESVQSATQVASIKVRPAFSTVPEDTKFIYVLTGCSDECQDLRFSLDATGEVTGPSGAVRSVRESDVLALLNAFAAAEFMYLDDSVVAGCDKSGPQVRLSMRAGAHEKELTYGRECTTEAAMRLRGLAQELRARAFPKEER